MNARQVIRDYGADVRDPAIAAEHLWWSAGRAPKRPLTAGQYVRQVTRVRGWTDGRLAVEGFNRWPASSWAPGSGGPGARFLDYWERAAERPQIVGSTHNPDPALARMALEARIPASVWHHHRVWGAAPEILSASGVRPLGRRVLLALIALARASGSALVAPAATLRTREIHRLATLQPWQAYVLRRAGLPVVEGATWLVDWERATAILDEVHPEAWRALGIHASAWKGDARRTPAWHLFASRPGVDAKMRHRAIREVSWRDWEAYYSPTLPVYVSAPVRPVLAPGSRRVRGGGIVRPVTDPTVIEADRTMSPVRAEFDRVIVAMARPDWMPSAPPVMAASLENDRPVRRVRKGGPAPLAPLAPLEEV